MFREVSIKITETLIKNGCISQKDAPIYSYGFRQLFMIILNISITLIIGIVLNQFWQSILFSIGYIPIRSFAGGYHAKTPQRCTLFSAFMVLIVLLIIKFVKIPTAIIFFLWIVSVGIIAILSPVQDIHKPLDELEKKVYKKRTIILLCLDSIIIVISKVLELNSIFYCFILALVSLSLMLILGSLKNKQMI